jgi:hypothetical protein
MSELQTNNIYDLKPGQYFQQDGREYIYINNNTARNLANQLIERVFGPVEVGMSIQYVRPGKWFIYMGKRYMKITLVKNNLGEVKNCVDQNGWTHYIKGLVEYAPI